MSKRFWPFIGGVERYVDDLAAAQAANGAAVRVLTIDRDLVANVPGRLPRRAFYRGIEVRRVPAFGSQRKQVPFGGFGDIVRSFRWADVVHLHDPRFLFETALTLRRLTGRPLIVHTHGLILHTKAYATLKRFLLRRYYGPAFAHLVDFVVADSEGDMELLRDSTGRALANLRLMRNAVDLDPLLGIGDATEPGLILAFGRIDRHKGLARLLRALSRLDKRAHLIVAGSGPSDLLSELEELARGLGIAARVTWAGQVSDAELYSLLSRAAVTAFPSEFEGFGIALLEAMAAARPVIASDLPTHREILGPDHADSLSDFSAPGAAEALRWSLALSDRDRHAIGASLRRRARTFDLRRLVADIDTLYGELRIGKR